VARFLLNVSFASMPTAPTVLDVVHSPVAGASRVTELSLFNHTADTRSQDHPPPVEPEEAAGATSINN
jgi:hypothetical protein